MDTVTYPSRTVAAELEHWVRLHVDVNEHPEAAAFFGVHAMPTALAVRSDGAVLGRRRNFVEPEAFGVWLEALRGTD